MARKIVNAVRTNMLEILNEQVKHLKVVSSARLFDKTECILLKTCMELSDKKLDTLEEMAITNRVIMSEEEKRQLLVTATLN